MDLDSALSDKPADGATATEILRADHREVAGLFTEFEASRGDARTQRIHVQTLCMKLELHDALEREIFYPAVAECDPRAVAESVHLHETLAAAVRRLRDAADDEGPLEDLLRSVRGLVEPHVADEEARLFPRVEAQSAGWQRDLGARLIKRKEDLTQSAEDLEGPAT